MQGRYLLIGIDGRHYAAHRLAWFYVHKEWPVGDLDHEGLDRFDNRVSKLRPATRSQNMANIRAHRDSSSGRKGVYLDKRRNRWVARIMKDGKVIWLGSFVDIEDACATYERAAIELFGEFGRGK